MVWLSQRGSWGGLSQEGQEVAQRAQRRRGKQGAQRAVGEHLGGVTLGRKVVAGGPSGLLELYPSRQGGVVRTVAWEGVVVAEAVDRPSVVGGCRRRRRRLRKLGTDPSQNLDAGCNPSIGLFLDLAAPERQE